MMLGSIPSAVAVLCLTAIAGTGNATPLFGIKTSEISNASTKNLVFPASPHIPSVDNQTSTWSNSDLTDYYDADAWELITTHFRNNSFSIQPYVSNGYIGSRLPVHGQGFAVDQNQTDPESSVQPINGWPLFDRRFTGSYLAGFWDYQKNTTATNYPELLKKGGESVISTLPVWSILGVTDLKSNKSYTVNTTEKEITNWRQSLSLKNGIVKTNLTWKPASSSQYNLSYTVLAHRELASLGVIRLDITATQDSDILIHDILEGDGSMRTIFEDKSIELKPHSIWTSVRPDGIRNVTAYEYSTVRFSRPTQVNDSTRGDFDSIASENNATITQDFRVSLKKNEAFTVYKYVGIASSDAFPNDPLLQAKTTALTAANSGWSTLLSRHNKAWQAVWDEGDIVIPGDDNLQISARATLYHLVANVRQGFEGTGLGDNSITVGGLSSDSYAGLVFWDADTWMFPGLEALHPDYASSILNYRQKLHGQAKNNLKELAKYAGVNDSAIYPWTSSRFGNCTSTGPCFDYEYHINIDIAQAQWNHYLSSNDTEWLAESAYPLIRDAANFFIHYVTMNGSTNGTYWTYNLTDPDEYANHVENGAYTNAGIAQLMYWATSASETLGEIVNPKWADIAKKIYIPEADDIDLTLEYDGMNGTTVIKQADVVMITYPLGYEQTQERAQTNLAYYAERQSADGPAMTYAIFAIDTSQLATFGSSAYTYLLYSSQPYLRAPFYQFSEQLYDDPQINGGTNPAFPFLTGHGGYLQVYTHGFTGYRPNADVLYLDPTLPPQLSEGYTLKGLKFQEGVFDIQINLNETKITRRSKNWVYSNTNGTEEVSSEKPIMLEIGARNPRSGNYTLRVNQTLTIGTYRPDLEDPQISGNVAQSKPVYSEDPWVAGRFPVALNDGDNSTVWQPLFNNKSSVVIDLGEKQSLSDAYFLWGTTPPSKLSVGVIDSGDNVTDAYGYLSKTQWIVQNYSVNVSKPYDPKANSSIISLLSGNESFVSFNRSASGRFIHLQVSGVHDEGAENGPTLTELSFSS